MRASSASVLVLALSPSVFACRSATLAKAETAVATALISDEQENQLGEMVHQEVEKEGIRFNNDPAVASYVDAIAGPIIEEARKERPNLDWHVHVVDDPETVNAFATPGGHLYVFTGLLLAAENNAEVAGVLAHEAGHVTARHAARALVQAYGLQAISAVITGKDPGLLAQIATVIATQGALLAHSRAAEHEADLFGVRYASAAGYDPHGIVQFFQKLEAQQGKVPRALTWLMTHPTAPERISAVEQYIAQNRLTGGGRGDEGLRAAQRAIGEPTARR